MNERWIIIKRTPGKVQFLRHEGHEQYWSNDRTDAMEYTRRDVAEKLAVKHGGEVTKL